MARPIGQVRREGADFVKPAADAIADEVTKARALEAVASSSGFHTPQLTGFDSAAAELRFRWVDGLTSVRESFLAHVTDPATDRTAVFESVGRALARIHGLLGLPSSREWIPPEHMLEIGRRRFGLTPSDFERLQPRAYLHCDFGFSNVCLAEDGQAPALYIIDPSPNFFVTQATLLHGPVHVDVANFCACLDGLVPLRFYARIHWDLARQLRESFLDAYEREAGCALDRTMVARMSYLTAACYLRGRRGGALGARIGLALLYNRWKGNLPS